MVTLGSRSVSAYRNIPNRFTSRLIRFSVAPLLNALTSNPVVQVVAVVRPTPHLGVCTFLPDLFAGIVVSLLYQRHR